MLITNEVILAVLQADPFTPVAPAATDAVFVSNIQSGFHNPRMHDRAVVKNTFGKLKQLFGGTLATLSFDVEIKGSGAAGTAPEFDALLRACGMASTVVASTSVTYLPTSDAANHEYATIYYHQDGKRKILQNAVGTVTGDADVGAPGMLHFSFYGHEGVEADAALPTPVYDSTVPPVFINAAFAIGAFSPVVSKISFDLGVVVVTPPDANSANGYGQVRINGRDVKGGFDPEAVLLATHDFISEWKSGAELVLDTGTIGSTAGNIWRVQCPRVSYRELSEAEREGLRSNDITFGAAETAAGDDEFSLIFT